MRAKDELSLIVLLGVLFNICKGFSHMDGFGSCQLDAKPGGEKFLKLKNFWLKFRIWFSLTIVVG